MTDWNQFKVVDLRTELRRRGIQHSGLKQELVQRLQKDDAGDASGSAIQPVEKLGPDTLIIDNQDSAMLPPEAQKAIPDNHVTSLSSSCGSEEQRVQSQKRKCRSATPLPDSKRCKAVSLSPLCESNTRPLDIEEVSVPNPLINQTGMSDAPVKSQGQHESDMQQIQPHGGDSEHEKHAVAAPVMASWDEHHSESPVFGETDKPSSQQQQQQQTMPSLHPPTRALYIRELMRPLRAEDVRAHLCSISATAQQGPDDDDAIEVFYLDPVRTHVFIIFKDLKRAIRARSALHNVVWPQECNRKPLWVDFIPTKEVRGWIIEESSDGRGENNKRWHVQYCRDPHGHVQVTLGAGPGLAQPQLVSQSDTRAEKQRSVPAGLTGNANDILLGPRKSRLDASHSRPIGPSDGPEMAPSAHASRDRSGRSLETTRSYPYISYRRVGKALASQRVKAIRSHYTRDLDRRLGREDEINRYTFESEYIFVDKGKENFVGIRPPHREARRHVQRGTQQPYRRQIPSPRHTGSEPHCTMTRDGQHSPRAIGDGSLRHTGRYHTLSRLGSSANEIPLGNRHRHPHGYGLE